MWRTTHLVAAQDKLLMQIPLLHKPTTHQSRAACLFLWYLLALYVCGEEGCLQTTKQQMRVAESDLISQFENLCDAHDVYTSHW